ncbi:hypothetical protein G9A89_010136 [Geosiphon pyriformis]|nr:hypothetical protein G9A89_010136 [Geosiphon pyriformis]
MDNLTWTDNDERELTPSWEGEESNKVKEKCASIVAKNCHQWAHAVAMTKNIRQQPSSIAMHVSSNALKDQNKWENEIIHHVWPVKKLSLIKEYGTTFWGKEKRATFPANTQSSSATRLRKRHQ